MILRIVGFSKMVEPNSLFYLCPLGRQYLRNSRYMSFTTNDKEKALLSISFSREKCTVPNKAATVFTTGCLNCFFYEASFFWQFFHHSIPEIPCTLTAVCNEEFNELIIYGFRYDVDTDYTKLDELLLCVFRYRLLCVNGLMLHSVAIEYNHSCILFFGPPSAGKSTQARLWEKHTNATSINNDRPFIIFENDRAYVFGSPWSGKEPCYVTVSYPLLLLVFVYQDKKNSVIELKEGEAFSYMYPCFYCNYVSKRLENLYIEFLQRIVKKYHVLKLHCDISENAVSTLKYIVDKTEAV